MQSIKRHKVLVAIIIYATLLISAIIAGLYSQSPRPRQLYPGEVTEYQGQNLSSVNDFIENSILGPQYINASTYRLKITGLVNTTIEYSYDEVISKFQKYQKVVTLLCVQGWSVKILWEGFLVKDLLQEAGVNSTAVALIFYAYDGFTTSLPLDYLINNNILIAYKMNDVVLPPERGFPFQLVAESKYGYKWIKWITQIEVTDNPNYLGYYERRGFSNDATVPRALP